MQQPVFRRLQTLRRLSCSHAAPADRVGHRALRAPTISVALDLEMPLHYALARRIGARAAALLGTDNGLPAFFSITSAATPTPNAASAIHAPAAGHELAVKLSNCLVPISGGWYVMPGTLITA